MGNFTTLADCWDECARLGLPQDFDNCAFMFIAPDGAVSYDLLGGAALVNHPKRAAGGIGWDNIEIFLDGLIEPDRMDDVMCWNDTDHLTWADAAKRWREMENIP